MTRAQHITLAQARALAHLAGADPDPARAIASIVADFERHESTCGEAVRVGLLLAERLNERDDIHDLRLAIGALK
jgi:hypothetical protein